MNIETAEAAHSHPHQQGSGEAEKFLGIHITDNLKWSTYTDSVLNKAHQRPLQPQKPEDIWVGHCDPQSFTDAPLRASCLAVSPPGTATAPSAIAGLSRGWCGQPNASPGAHCLPSRTPTERPRRSSRASATRAMFCSPRYHPEGEGSTG
jgi:hypothetical protein